MMVDTRKLVTPEVDTLLCEPLSLYHSEHREEIGSKYRTQTSLNSCGSMVTFLRSRGMSRIASCWEMKKVYLVG
jgi:hypothetical protein